MGTKRSGWWKESERHKLAQKGIPSNPSKVYVKTELQEKPPLYVDYEVTGLDHYKNPKTVSYPNGLKLEDRKLFNEEIGDTETNEERQEIYDRWKQWKRDRFTKHVDYLVSNIGFNGEYQPYFVTREHVPPDGFRWVDDEEEIEIAKNRLLGIVTKYGIDEFPQFMTYEEYINQFGPYEASQYEKDLGIKRERRKYTPRKKKVAPEVELEKRIKSHEEKRIEEMKERQKAFRDERRKW